MAKDSIQEGDLLWEPGEKRKSKHVIAYLNYLKKTKSLNFTSYGELWDWSVKY